MKINKIFIQFDEHWFETTPTITLSDEYLHGSSTAGAVCVGYTEISSINESGNTVSSDFEVPYMRFKTVSGSDGIECKANFNDLKTSLVDNGDGQYFIPLLEEYSYTRSLFYGSFSSIDELIFQTALFIKDHNYKPVVLMPSKTLTYFLASENIDFITTTYSKSG